MLVPAWMLVVLMASPSAPKDEAPVARGKPKTVAVRELLQWPRMPADRFGCMLETRLGLRDPRFNCSSREPAPRGDPCRDPGPYEAGPALPGEGADLVRGLGQGETVRLEWEGGALREVSLTLKGKRSADEIGRLLGLEFTPTRDAQVLAELNAPKAHPNIMSISIQACSQEATCVLIQGFEHLGAADLECPSDEVPPEASPGRAPPPQSAPSTGAEPGPGPKR